MDVIDAIRARRSVRSYSDKSLPEETMRELLEAARLAPSCKNLQGYRYIPVIDKAVIHSLRDAYKQHFVCTAPGLMIACFYPPVYCESSWEESRDGRADKDVCRSIAMKDLAISTAFLVLRATELGLGTCYVCDQKSEIIREKLDIQLPMDVLATITVGYPKDSSLRKRKKLSIYQITHLDNI